MENKEPVIYKNKALKDLKGIKDVLVGMGDPFLANMVNRSIEAIDALKPIENAEIVTYCFECAKHDTVNCPMFGSNGRRMPKATGFCGAGSKT